MKHKQELEIHFYEWNAHRWLESDSRHQLDPLSRSIYRDCLDMCHAQGTIPKNLSVLASKCLVSVEEMEASWPKIARHFRVHKHDPTQLENKFAVIFRNKYRKYIEEQKKRRKKGIDKAIANKEIQDAGSTVVTSRNDLKTLTLTKTVTKKETPEPLSPLEAAVVEVASRIYERHPPVRRCGLKEIARCLRSIVRRDSGIGDKRELLFAIDRNHAAWCATDGWTKDGGEYSKGLDNWLAPTVGRFELTPPPSNTVARKHRSVLDGITEEMTR